MIAVALSLALAAALSDDPFAPLGVYDGDWSVTSAQAAGGIATPDRLSNRCRRSETYFTCEQILNGKTVALVVYVAGDKPGAYHSQVVFPTGRAAGRSDLSVEGDRWTYLTNDADGKPSGRVVNLFSGRDRIHFDVYKSDGAGGWTKTGEGDEVRAPAPH